MRNTSDRGRLHPNSMKELRRLVLWHGYDAVQAALYAIKEQIDKEKRREEREAFPAAHERKP